MNKDDPAHPCGLVAKSFFNDRYVLKNKQTGKVVPINENGIAWKTDLDNKFKNVEEWKKADGTECKECEHNDKGDGCKTTPTGNEKFECWKDV